MTNSPMSEASLPPVNGKSHAGTNGSLEDSRPSTASTAPPAEFAALVALAEQIAAQPERLALKSGDSTVAESSMNALQGVFSSALKSEASSLPHISKFLMETLGPDPAETRSKSKKRKRPAASAKTHSFFAPTPLEGLVTDGMGTDQLWQQLEYRGKAIEKVLSEILVYAGGQGANEDGEPDDELELKAKSKEAEDELDDAASEELVSHLSSLSDAELRALGIDPELRDQLMADDDEDEDGDFEPDPNDEDEEGPNYPEGYPGASDLSSDEDEEDYQPGSSKRVYLEPLKTEKEQRKKKEERERRDMERQQDFASLRQDMDALADEDQDSDSDEEEDMEDAEVSAANVTRKPQSLLDQLDEPGTSGSSGSKRKGPRHPTLDDDFFSIDEFNRETEEAERREIFKEAGADDGEDDEDVDMFRPLEGDDADLDMDLDEDDSSRPGAGMDPADIRYADFFLPPPSGHSGNKGAARRRAKGKGKGSRVGQGAKLAKQERDKAAVDFAEGDDDSEEDEEEEEEGDGLAEDAETSEPSSSGEESDDDDETPSKPTRVRFAPTVAIRNIKARPNRSLFDSALTPEMLSALYSEGDGSDDEEDGDENEDDDADTDEEMGEGSDAASEESEAGVDEGDDSEDEREVESEAGDSAFDEERQDMTARRFAGDLFEDDDASEGEGDSSAKLSAHERRLAELQREISRLESENVGAKDWTLAGEASSRARPKDSLLEEDLDFEQSAKPTPTITIERTESLEELIKRRILEGRFDDVVPRRVVAQPEYKPDFELSDRKSSRGLAEEYESDYQRRAEDGGEEGAYKGESERRLEKDKAEVEDLMNDLFDKLDALSNAHFVPKAPQGTITTLSNAPALTAESGLPTSVGETSQLAPQEVFNNREGGRVNAILDGSQGSLTPEEKKRLHQRRKKEKKSEHEAREREQQMKKLNSQAGKKVQGNSAGETRREKQDALKKLIGNKGVSVVGKGGADASSKGKGKGKVQQQEGEKKAEKFKL